jgi:hypothetical protein
MICKITPKFVYLNQRGRAGFVFGEVRDSSLAPSQLVLLNSEILLLHSLFSLWYLSFMSLVVFETATVVVHLIVYNGYAPKAHPDSGA